MLDVETRLKWVDTIYPYSGRHMLKRILLFAVAVVLLAAIPFHDSGATTVAWVRVVCPVCGHDFVGTEIASYTHFGCRERDFSDMPFAMFGRTRTCPHCLYAGVGESFEAGSLKLRDELGRLPKLLDKSRIAKLDARDEELLRLSIAEACLNLRTAGFKEKVDVQMRIYFASKREDNPELLKAERAKLLDLLERALAAGTYSGGDEALFTYLRAEMLRLTGSDTNAMLQFIKTKTLVGKLPPAKDEDESFAWLAKWSDEQIRRMTYPNRSLEELKALVAKGGDDRRIALVALAERNDAAAWSVIAAYVMGDSERLIELEGDVKLTREKMKLDPEFWRWGKEFYAAAVAADEKGKARQEMTRFKNRFAYLFDDARNTWNPNPLHAAELAQELKKLAPDFMTAYTVEAGDTLSQISQRYGLASFRMEELNPQVRDKDQIQVGQKLQRLVLPAGWDEKQTLRHLPLAIKSGEPAAVAFFLEWVQTIGRRGLDEYRFQIRSVFEVLPKAPGLDAALKLSPHPEPTQRLLRLSLRAIAGDAAAPAELVELLKTVSIAPLGFSDDHWSVASQALIACGNPALKDELFARMQPRTEKKADRDLLRSDAVNLNLEWIFAETVVALGTAEDIPKLEAMVAKLPLTAKDARDGSYQERERVEAPMLSLKLRLLAEACRK